ncbi:MAG: nucleotide sugar dehydrogenase [Peptostreptococcaceae bacterium]
MLYSKSEYNKIAVIGLGYVGLPLAIEFDKHFSVIGFDIDKNKIKSYIEGIDATNEVGDDNLKNSTIEFTSDETKLKEANFYIIAVPTPINIDKTPDLNPIISASEIVGRNLESGAVIVYESTVYPGLTEEVCIPILEKSSSLKCKDDFKVGYSPERINPGDKVNKLPSIVKIVSGCDEEALEIISNIYGVIIKAGLCKVKNIKVAEAAKILENSQRDINIAFVNEVAMIFHKMDIDINEVLNACKTKWNFLDFTPGLVGGNCIGVDPYYLIYKANTLSCSSQIISSARNINDNMGNYIGENIIKKLILCNKKVKNANVGIFGITFKEDCPDCSNSKVVDIINYLKEYDVNIKVFDPVASFDEIKKKFNVELCKIEEMKDFDVIVFAVNHQFFKDTFNIENISILYQSDTKILIDIKGIFDDTDKYVYWRL